VDEAGAIAMYLRRKKVVPEHLLQVPELCLGLELFYRAFMELSSCRQVGMGEGPIPWTAIQSWCTENGVQADQRHRVFHHVRQMDLAYLKHQADTLKTKNGGK
jgi:hypothetical protein